MTSIYQLKPKFQTLLRPLTGFFHRIGLTANGVTLGALLASLAYGAWMSLDSASRWPFLLLPAFLLLRMALNAIDGMLARQYRQQSELGALLNECGDVVSDAALYAPFGLLPGVRGELVMAVVFLALLTEFIGVLGQAIGGARRYDGPFGKSDRACAFAVLGLLIGSAVPLLPYLNLILLIMLVLLGWTGLNRARRALRRQ